MILMSLWLWSCANNVNKKCKKDGVFTVSYKNRKGQTLKRQFYHDGFKRKKQEYGDWTLARIRQRRVCVPVCQPTSISSSSYRSANT